MRSKFFVVLVIVSMLLCVPGQVWAQKSDSPDASPAPDSLPGPSKTPAADELNLDEAKRAIQFGVGSSVVSILTQASSTKDGRIKTEAGTLVDNLNDDLVVATLNYFKAIEDTSILSRILTRLETFPDNSMKLNLALLDFLNQKSIESTETIKKTLRDMIDSPRKEIQAQAIKVLSGKGDSSDADRLVDVFKNSDTSVQSRQAIITAIGILSSSKSLEFLRGILENEDEDKEIRNLAISSAGKLGDLESLPAILRFMQDKQNVQIRLASIQALEGYPLEKVKDAYFQALRDDFWRNRLATVRVIADKKYPDYAAAISYMAEKDPETPIRLEALRYLSGLASSEAKTLLKKMILDEKTLSAVRGRSIEILMDLDCAFIAKDLKSMVEKEWNNEKSYVIPVVGKKLATLNDPAGADLARLFLGHRDVGLVISAIRWIQLNKAVTFIPDLQILAAKTGVIKSNAEAALKDLGK